MAGRILSLSRCRFATVMLAAITLIVSSVAAQAADEASGGLSGSHMAFRYERDYPTIPYNRIATDNPIARLQSALDNGTAHLKFEAPRGYLDSLLKALKIDLSSQTLVYSKTSLQVEAISAATPRAIYFNDDTYVAWVQGGGMLEIMTADARLGAVFYTLPNRQAARVKLEREASRCLTCHDTFAMAGGGVPQFRFTSSVVGRNGVAFGGRSGVDTTDQTPISERWGGWFVSGRSGRQAHLGNILVDNAQEMAGRKPAQSADLESLDGLLDVRPYPTNKSDIVALLVLEHQAYLHNQITRANFKARTVLAKTEPGQPVDALKWNDLSSKSQLALSKLLESLVHALFFVDAAGLDAPVASTSGFDRWFHAQPPRDRQGRSLRDLDLQTRVFKHRLSYLIYSPGFRGLPGCAKEFVYSRLTEVLSGRDTSPAFRHLPAEERATISQILLQTEPEFARFASANRQAGAT